MGKKLTRVVSLLFMTLIMVFGSVANVSNVSAAGSIFTNNSNGIGQTEMNVDGLQSGTWMSANGDKSSYDSNDYTTSYMNMNPVVSSATQVANFKNTTAADMNLNVVLELPKYGDAQTIAIYNGGEFAAQDGLTYKYSYAPGKYGDYDASNVAGLIAVQIQGTLKAGQEATYNLPLTINYTSDLAGTKMRMGILNFATYENSVLDIFASEQMPGLDLKNYDKSYFAAILNDNGTYSAAPQEIQNLMPVQNAAGELTYDNFYLGYGKVDDSVLYKGGAYYIQLDPIKNAIRNDGYSVHVDTATDKLMDHYEYRTDGPGIEFNSLTDKKLDPKQTYVEVRKVIDTTDYTIDEGSTWNTPWDKSKDVTVYDHKKGTVDVTDPNVKITGNVDTSKAGKYKITYTYLPDNVSKTQTVTVIGEATTGNVIAEYVDDNGNVIANEEKLTGNIGDSYETKQKDIAGYTFKEVKGNAKGTFAKDDQAVIYVYTKDTASKPTNPGKPGNNNNNKPSAPSIKKPVVKKAIKKVLPQTGEANTSMMVLTGAMMLAAAAVYVMKRKRA